MPVATIQVVIVTPSDLVGSGLCAALEAQYHRVRVFNSLDDGDRDPSPQIVFADDRLSETGSPACLVQRVQARFPDSRIVLLTTSCEPLYVWGAVAGGARGCLYLEDRLVKRIHTIVEDVLEGGLYLSPTAQTALVTIQHYRDEPLTDYERAVLRLMSRHWTAARIAQELGRSVGAIYQLQKHLRDVFEAQTNGELVHKVTSLQLLESTA